MALRVQDMSPEVLAMAEPWDMIDDLMEGTAAMRRAGEKWLPKWPNEDDEAYKTRLATATLFPAYERTVAVMSGKPFAKQLQMGEDIPPRLVELLEDCDLQGRSLHAFASELMQEIIARGIAGVLVDSPKRPQEARTVADERAAGIRPYLVLVKARQILGWRSAQGADGVVRLTQLRLAESAEVDDGEYGVKRVSRVRVLVPGGYALFQETDKDTYVEIERGSTSIKEIPFVPFYGQRRAFMVSKPPLLSLAYLNVKHWQSESDQDTILHVARVPILFMSGVDEKTALTIGGSSAVRSDQTGAEMKYVEHSGAAIGAGKESLQELEARMRQTGAELLILRAAGPSKTATESSHEAEGNKSDLQRITESVEDGLDQTLQLMAGWLGLPDGGHVTLYKDFGSAMLSDQSATTIVTAQQAGIISKETALNELKRHGTLAPDLDVEAEMEAVDAEGPPLGMMQQAPPQNPPQGTPPTNLPPEGPDGNGQ